MLSKVCSQCVENLSGICLPFLATFWHFSTIFGNFWGRSLFFRWRGAQIKGLDLRHSYLVLSMFTMCGKAFWNFLPFWLLFGIFQWFLATFGEGHCFRCGAQIKGPFIVLTKNCLKVSRQHTKNLEKSKSVINNTLLQTGFYPVAFKVLHTTLSNCLYCHRDTPHRIVA